MHREHAVEIGGREVDEQGLLNDPRIVYEMRRVAKCSARCADDGLHIGFARDVARRSDRSSALRFDLRCNGLARLSAQVVDRHSVAVGGEPKRAGAPDSRSRPGDDDALHHTAS